MQAEKRGLLIVAAFIAVLVALLWRDTAPPEKIKVERVPERDAELSIVGKAS